MTQAGEEHKAKCSPVIIKMPTKVMKSATHGCIFMAFKSPRQQANIGPLGVESMDISGQNRQTFTTLQNLEAAKVKRMEKRSQKWC